MLERALSTALNLLNRLDDESDEPQPEVFGCRSCSLIYYPRCYHYSPESIPKRRDPPAWSLCPVCNERSMEALGPVPDFVESEKGVFLLDNEGDILGPYYSRAGAQLALWDWFDRKRQHGNRKEESSQEGKVVRLVSKEGR